MDDAKNRGTTNKILNNTCYDQGDAKGENYEMRSEIRISGDYLEEQESDDAIMSDKMRNAIEDLMANNERVDNIISEFDQKKFNKEVVNELFGIILDRFRKKGNSVFMNTIQVFDAMVCITGLKYKNLFEMLDITYKQMLLDDLDESHSILSGGFGGHNKKMY